MLDNLQRFLTEEIAPRAGELDAAVEVAREGFTALRDAKLLDCQLSETRSGKEWLAHHWRYQYTVARTSGTLSFLTKQNSAARSYLAEHGKASINITAIADGVVEGTQTLGIAFFCGSGPGGLQATDVGDDIVVEGILPWATGHGILDSLVIDFYLDGEIYAGVVPFRSDEKGDGSISFSDPLDLFALRGSGTVKGALRNWAIPKSVIFGPVPPVERYGNGTTYLSQPIMLLGTCAAMLDFLGDRERYKPPRDAGEAFEACHAGYVARLDELRTQLETAGLDEPTVDWALGRKAEVTRFARACGGFGRAAVGASASLERHPVRRVLRELEIFPLLGNPPGTRQHNFDNLRRSLPEPT